MPKYPWHEVVASSEAMLQGDFIDSCPVIIPTSELLLNQPVSAEVVEYDVIVMSQSCDLAARKIELVLVCPVWPLAEFEKRSDFFKSRKGKEALRRGEVPGYHLLNACRIDQYKKAIMVVDFRSVYSVSFAFLEGFASQATSRLRLLPPYREHLSQSFARFFMRVGLPADIPPFR